MNKDIRLSVSFWDHWKTIILKSDLGYAAIESLQRLWCFAAINKPDGTLSGMTLRTIEIAAHWSGEPGAFVSKLVELRFLDAQDGVFVLHDWEDHNGYAAHAVDRAAQGKKAADARWKRRTGGDSGPKGGKNADSNADSIAQSIAPSNAPIPIPIPIPIPVPIPTPEGRRDGERPAAANVVPIDRTPYQALVDAYHAELPTMRRVAKLTEARKQTIRAAWLDDLIGPDLDKWREFFRYVHHSCPFVTGQKPGRDGQIFDAGLDWLLDANNLVKLVEGKYEEGARHG